MRQCCQQRSENYQQIAVKLGLSWTHLPPFSLLSWHLPFYITTPISQETDEESLADDEESMKMMNVWKGENSRFYTILQVDASAEEEEEEEDCPWRWGHGQAQPRIVAERKKERKKHRERERERVKNCGSRYLNQYLGKSILDILNPIIVWGRSQYRCSCAEIRSIYRLPRFAQLVHCRLYWLCWMSSPSLQDLSPYSSLSLFVSLSEYYMHYGTNPIHGRFWDCTVSFFPQGFWSFEISFVPQVLGGKEKECKESCKNHCVCGPTWGVLQAPVLLVQNSYELDILLLNPARK